MYSLFFPVLSKHSTIGIFCNTFIEGEYFSWSCHFLTTSDSHGILQLAFVLVGIHSASVSNLFLRITVYLLLISLSVSEDPA